MHSVSIKELVVTISNYPAIADVHLELETKHLTLLTGANGSGKTTLLKTISGLIEPARGTIEIQTKRITNSRELRHLFAYVGHSPLYMRHIKVIDHLKLCKKLDQSKSDLALDINRGLELFDLTDRKNIEVSKLSAGQTRRLHLLSALVRNTPTLCLDEPHASLDKESKDLIDDLIIEQHDKGRNFIIATHDPQRLWDNASKTFELKTGCLFEVPK